MPRADNYFADIDSHFLRAIYATPKGAIRLAVLQRDLAPHLAPQNLHILDIGGGAGQMALWCAALGHRVTLIDRSEPLLEQAQRSAIAMHAAERINFICADALSGIAAVNEYDGVLCHAVLEWVEHGEKLLQICANALKPNGFFSLMYYNRTALEYTHHVFGNFAYVDAGLKAKKRAKLTPDYPRTAAWVQTQLEGLPLIAQSGIRCFYDYMKPKDREANTLEAIVQHELALSSRTAFLPVARYIHELRRKPLDRTANNQ